MPADFYHQNGRNIQMERKAFIILSIMILPLVVIVNENPSAKVAMHIYLRMAFLFSTLFLVLNKNHSESG